MNINEKEELKMSETIEINCDEQTTGELKTTEIKNELIPIESNSMDIYTKDKFSVLNGLDLVKKEDIQYLQEHVEDYKERFVSRSFFRSDFEMRYGVLGDSEHPTIDSKYWQAIGEQAVHVQEFYSLGYEYEKLLADIEYIEAQIEELQFQLSKQFEHDFNRKKIEAKLKKKEIELQEKQFGLILQRKTAKERMKEIRNWDVIISELKPLVKHGIDDFEKHHAERYIRRYGQRLQNLNVLNGEDKEHVVKHFSSFAQAPENQELAKEYIENFQRVNQIENNNTVEQIKQIEDKKETPLIEVKETAQLDYKSKDEMMEKDPITQKFFNRSVRKILVATPHRRNPKDSPIDRNVTDFFKLQTPAAFDVLMEQPHGFTVPDARNFVVNKAITEGFDYIFFVDDDLLIPKNALVQLIHHKADIVGGFYYRKYFPLESCGMHVNEKNQPSSIENFKIGDVIHDTLVLPSGCTLFNVEVFKQMESPWYRTCTVNGRPSITEDTYICQKARDLGFDVVTDLGIQCIHIDKENGILYGHPEIVNVMKNNDGSLKTEVYENWRNYFSI